MVVFRDRGLARERQQREAGDREILNGLGAGFIDYSDLEIGQALEIPAATPTQMMRNLAASDANRRLSGPWRDHDFWDNTAKLVRSRALFDTFRVSHFIRVIPHKLGAVLRVAYVTGTLEFAAVNMPLTAQVNDEETIRANFIDVATRNQFFTNGARIMLTATEPVTILEFSPEFYPGSYEL